MSYRQQVVILARSLRGRFDKDSSLALYVEAYPPDKRRRDLDNIFKSLLDSLQYSGVYVDDSQINEIYVVRKEASKPGRIIITLEEL